MANYEYTLAMAVQAQGFVVSALEGSYLASRMQFLIEMFRIKTLRLIFDLAHCLTPGVYFDNIYKRLVVDCKRKERKRL